MKYRIIKKKLLFLHHVTTLPSSSLAKEILDAQTSLALPGLVQECKEWLIRFEIYRVELYTKPQWKKLIREKIIKENKNDILNQMKSYKKLKYDDFKDEEFRVQPYLQKLNIPQARIMFKLKSLMTPTVRMNFSSDPKHAANMWTCIRCSSDGDLYGFRDTQKHIICCPGYAVLRQDKDLNNDKDLVTYFQQVIKHRQDND